ncbi:unnamed protein product [Bursaphelenchus xylophilus]|uniref:(pine wood nematode) hypothetical protein n=1 Tax=Bursaphelenchus xylophilus TaxID=6326 RepID=A0A1I7STM4_BURXY|nr:unnamed protein product [Bursaphelenchus xylophilus]CAG9108220.1 unnamed protein product [Bursaphelenchus xylophilus]
MTRIRKSLSLLLFILLDFGGSQSTPVIGGPCKLGSADVNIGGKQTQFYLHCDVEDPSKDVGIWVVKTKGRPNEGRTLPYAEPTVVSPYQQHPKKSEKLPLSPIVCEQLQAQENGYCNIPETCLQSNSEDPNSYLQCNPVTRKWAKKYCQQGFWFSFEHQSCVAHAFGSTKGIRQHSRKASQVPTMHAYPSNGGVVCTYAQCSPANPCSTGTCNNGYCCSSGGSGALMGVPMTMSSYPCPRCNQFFSYACPNGASPYGTCNNGVCATGYQCMQTTNLCCPTTTSLRSYSSCPAGSNGGGACVSGQCSPGYSCNSNNVCCAQVVPATVCPDGTQAAGACVNNMCGTGFTCNQGLCCTNTSQTPRCLDGSQAIGACMQGKCGSGYTCTTGNICCPSTLNACPNGQQSIGTCVNGKCPDGYTCINNQCCGPPAAGNTASTATCAEADSSGPCGADGNCPEPGYLCDTANNWCCPQIMGSAVGPCIAGAGGTRLCPEGYACSGPGVGNCFRLNTGTCAPEDQFGPCGVNNQCPPNYTCYGGFCCRNGSFRRKKRSSFLIDYFNH